MKVVSETIKNEVNGQRGGFISTLLGLLGASLLGNLLTGEGVIRAGEGTITTSQRRITIRAGQDF